jgi:hypothetical protein
LSNAFFREKSPKVPGDAGVHAAADSVSGLIFEFGNGMK